jgi:hypothetical protein
VSGNDQVNTKFPPKQNLLVVHHSEKTNQNLFLISIPRGMVDVQGDQFVAYFLPEKETLGKRKRDQEEEKEYTEGDE